MTRIAVICSFATGHVHALAEATTAGRPRSAPMCGFVASPELALWDATDANPQCASPGAAAPAAARHQGRRLAGVTAQLAGARIVQATANVGGDGR